MKKTTKILALLLSVILLLGLLPTTGLAADVVASGYCGGEGDRINLQGTMNDVLDTAYYAHPVSWAVEYEITNGMTPTKFCPDMACTRGQMVTFLWRAAGRPTTTLLNCPFTDVQLSKYYGTALRWAYANGIVNGITLTTFCPDDMVTRGQMATILFRYANIISDVPAVSNDSPFQDVTRSDYYYDAVLWAYSSGVTTGTSDTKFSPKASCTRAQIVTFLYRYFVEPAIPANGIKFWTFQSLHAEYLEAMANLWNKTHPDEPIRLFTSIYDFDDMHIKLSMALQAGIGAPDLVDIELGKFINFTNGDIQLLPLNDIVEPELDNIVKGRVDIYAKNGNYYGIDYHTGAAVIYYNTELCEAAGIDWRNITTWDEYYEAGKKLKKTFPNKYWTSVESSDIWHMWPQLAELGADMTDANGNVTIDTPEMAKVLTYNRKLIDEDIAVVAPGTYHHSEEFYDLMNDGNVAAIVMPFWYLDRFPNYMPDLAGKIATRPLPVWEKGQNRSIGQGGTATSITNQARNPDLVKRFLAFAKLSVEGGIMGWELCGFDPIRTDVWSMEDVTHDPYNYFVSYYANNPFDALLEIKDEIVGFNNNIALPSALDAMKCDVLYRAYCEPDVDIPSMLKEVQANFDEWWK